MGVQDMAAGGVSGSVFQAYEGSLIPYITNSRGFRTVTCDPNESGSNLESSCVGGLAVYDANNSLHLGVVVQHAFLPQGKIIQVVSAIDGCLVVHPLDKPGIGLPTHILVPIVGSPDAP